VPPELLCNEPFSLYNIKTKRMKNRIMKVLATIIFIIFVPLMSILLVLKYSDNPFWRIKRNFQAVMYIVNLGHPKSGTFVN